MEKTSEQLHSEILLKIEDLYNKKDKDGKPVGKNFVTHLLRAYLPVSKIHKKWDNPKKSKLKCAITGYSLCTIEDAFAALNSEGMSEKLAQHLKYAFNGVEVEHPMKKELKGKVLAYTGKDTDTVMCLDAVKAFIDWFQTKILHGDKHVAWVSQDIRRKETIAVVREQLPKDEDQKKIDMIEKKMKHPQRATMSLGELSVLKELQAKLKEKEEEGK